MRRTFWAFVAVALVIPACGNAQGGASKLAIRDVKIGKGPKAAPGDLLAMAYTGTLVNGKVFDSNEGKNGKPYAFVLGRGSVIQGWDLGMVGMQVGGVRKLTIPAALGYGDRPMTQIPAGSELHFTVKLLDIVKKGEESYFDKKDLKVGRGKAAKDGSTVTVNYVGTLVNGLVFDSTQELGKPVIFKMGEGKGLRAFELGITGMRAGGKRRLRLPPAVAFGKLGLMGKVPPDSVVIYIVTMEKVQ